MAQIQWLAVENTVSRKKNANQQVVQFLILVERLSYDKQVEVFWAGSDGVWHTMLANYQGPHGNQQELWQARLTGSGKSNQLLGNISFAFRLRCQAGEFWDNNAGLNYQSRQGSGVTLAAQLALQHLNFKHRLEDEQQFAAIKIAVNAALITDSVVIHWTSDNWRSSHQTVCHYQKRLKQHGAKVYTARLPVINSFAVEYCVSGKTAQSELVWDNNGGSNYRLSREPLKVMILNLHCYQEDQQDKKFSQIAKAIREQGADVVCFQEVAEHWNHGHGDWASNSANIINQRLKPPMHLYTDWSHLGFDKYREGVAILSRYPLLHTQSRYVSDSHDAYSIHSRKVVMANIQVPYLGSINVFSAHLSWWEDGFQEQFQRLCEWADSQSHPSLSATLLCGDFNIAAGSIGYQQVVLTNQYEDQYLAANHQGLFEKIFRVNDAHWGNWLSDDYRIDYIFMNKTSNLRVTAARVLFTDWDYGQVSDHCGYLMSFEPK